MRLVMRTRATLMHSTQESRVFQPVCKFPGVKPSSAMKGVCVRCCDVFCGAAVHVCARACVCESW